jgi:hypothetical protein
MLKKTGWLSAGLTLAAFSAVASFALGSAGSAQAAVVYCKTAGVPQGCVVRPTPVAVVATPVVGVARVGVARVGVGVGARGVGVRPGTPMNRGGPVNRVGRR